MGTYSNVFHKDSLSALMRPCVYMFMRGKEVRYIGYGKHGFLRFGLHRHEQRIAAEADTTKVFWFKRDSSARTAEILAIGCVRPPLNTQYRNGLVGEPLTKNKTLNAFLRKIPRPNLSTRESLDLAVLKCLQAGGEVTLAAVSEQVNVVSRNHVTDSLERLMRMGKVMRRRSLTASSSPYVYRLADVQAFVDGVAA